MKIPIKTEEEIQIMKEGGQKLSLILKNLVRLLKPGINLLEIEKKAVQLIKDSGGKAGFKRVPGYKWATCLNINDEIVHGVPKDYIIKAGNVVNIDIGLYYKGFNTDMSSTFYVENQKLNTPPRWPNGLLGGGEKKRSIDKFLAAGRKALREAIKQAEDGQRVGNISKTIQELIEGDGFNCARNLTGHGIGRLLHEPPAVPCFLEKGKKVEDTPLLKQGMVLAVEVIFTQGKPELIVDSKDKWTIKTLDGKISAVFEETIAITKAKPLILTKNCNSC